MAASTTPCGGLVIGLQRGGGPGVLAHVSSRVIGAVNGQEVGEWGLNDDCRCLGVPW